MGHLWFYIALVVSIIGAALIWRRWRAAARRAQRQRAMPEFEELREELAKQFLQAAAATGKPRGLRWTSVELTGQPVFATDAASGALCALVGATISFEAVEGGDMEEVEAVGNLRSATAVFIFRSGQWTTDGRVIFNLEPAEALTRFQSSLVPVNS
jgi:hypothetical protein